MICKLCWGLLSLCRGVLSPAPPLSFMELLTLWTTAPASLQGEGSSGIFSHGFRRSRFIVICGTWTIYHNTKAKNWVAHTTERCFLAVVESCSLISWWPQTWLLEFCLGWQVLSSMHVWHWCLSFLQDNCLEVAPLSSSQTEMSL